MALNLLERSSLHSLPRRRSAHPLLWGHSHRNASRCDWSASGGAGYRLAGWRFSWSCSELPWRLALAKTARLDRKPPLGETTAPTGLPTAGGSRSTVGTLWTWNRGTGTLKCGSSTEAVEPLADSRRTLPTTTFLVGGAVRHRSSSTVAQASRTTIRSRSTASSQPGRHGAEDQKDSGHTQLLGACTGRYTSPRKVRGGRSRLHQGLRRNDKRETRRAAAGVCRRAYVVSGRTAARLLRERELGDYCGARRTRPRPGAGPLPRRAPRVVARQRANRIPLPFRQRARLIDRRPRDAASREQ